jgi:hypothetical protein
MKRFLCWSFLIASVVIAAEQAPVEKADDFLDLLPKAAQPQSPGGRAPRVIRSRGPWYEGMPTPKSLPIKIMLLSIDQTNYALGDPATFEVSLENVGPVSLTIPWGAPIDRERIDPGPEEPPGFLAATITLCSNEDQVASSAVYGSRLVPRSLRSLKPGEQVRVRAYARISILDSTLIGKLLTDIDLKARFDFQGGYPEELPPRQPWLPAVSANSIRVRLQTYRGSEP